MQNLVEVNYGQTGKSKKTNALGMREMQEKAFAANSAQYMLIKAPPASGKSRALMFIALEKLHHQGIKKAIVAVPERTIGASFAPTELTKFGFFADWSPNPRYNLCSPSSAAGFASVELFFQARPELRYRTISCAEPACQQASSQKTLGCIVC